MSIRRALARALMRALARAMALALLVLVCGPVGAEPRVRALLVGVSDYLYLDADLRGPRNDVRLMRAALLARGVAGDRITVLSQDDTIPTRAAILGALDHLAAISGPGDQVVFYFSGHGTQAPDLDGDEMGGYDEIFLPADARGWSDATRSVENAILDDDFRRKMAAITATGAGLVAILDACHAATGFRALGGRGVARVIAPAQLNIPDLAPVAAGTPEPPLTGNFAFLYAAQSDERAFEYPTGPKEDPASWHGGFTMALTRVLETVPDLTWGQVLLATQGAMKAAANGQTPDGEGPLLSAPVFGTASPPDPRIPYQGLTLSAGLLSGQSLGASFALYGDATSQEVLARARINAIDARSATLEITQGNAPKSGYGMQIAPGLPPMVRFSPLLRRDPDDGFEYGAFGDALARIGAGDMRGAAEFDAVPYDIGLVLSAGVLALTGGDGLLDPLGPGTSPRSDADGLAAAMERAARVYRLRAALALAGQSGVSALLQAGAGLAVEVGHRKGQGNGNGNGCGPDLGDETRPVRDGHITAPCDQLWLHLRNTSITARDVTVLYVDSGNRISVLWPTGNLSNRLAFNEETDVGVQIVDGPSGAEEMIVIAVPAVPGAPRTVLDGLADPDNQTRAAAGPTAGYLLGAVRSGARNRNFSFRKALDPVEVTRIGFDFQNRKKGR